MENAILEFVETTAIANRKKDKIPALRQADECLVRLRLLLRISFELKFINSVSYEYGSAQLVELG